MQKISITLVLFFIVLFTQAQELPKPLVKTKIQTDFNLVFIPVELQSKTQYLIMDTGAGFSVIDDAMAEQFGFEVKNKQVYDAPGGKVNVGQIDSLSFKIDNFSVLLPQTAAANLREGGFNDYIGRECLGILGHDFISQYTIKIDYQNQLLEIYDTATFVYDGKGQELKTTIISAGSPIVEGNLFSGNKSIQGKWLMDTGSTMSIGLRKGFVTENNIQNDVEILESIAVGFGGSSEGKVLGIKGFEMAGIKMNELVSGYSEDEEANNFDDDGVIGGQILKNFTFIIDYKNNRFILEQPKKKVKISHDRSGLMLAARGETFDNFEVLHVFKNSPAQKAGIQKGDFIVKINSKSSADYSLGNLWKQLQHSKNKTFQFEIERGGSTIYKQLRLKDYVPF